MNASHLLSLLLCLLLLPLLRGQETSPETAPQVGVVATARFINGQVELRWFPAEAAIWRHANRAGYTLERMDLDEGTWRPLSATPILPYTAEQWARLPQASPYVRAASQAVLSPQATPAERASFFDWERYQNDENGIFLFFLAAAALDADASLGAGLRYVDATIVRGKRYAYRISVNGWKGGGQATSAFVVVDDTESPYEAPALEGVRYEELDGAVRIVWPASNQALFPAFNVERSADGVRFERINRLPLLFATNADEWHFTDSVANYQPHTYRVVGVTPFGDASAPSTAFRAMGRDLTPPPPAANLKAEGSRQSIRITWEWPEGVADLEGFHVGRSANVNGPFQMLTERPLPRSARQFTDPDPKVFEPFYTVVALDTAQNASPSFAVMARVQDTDPPARPSGLQGECDTAGVVRIQWQPNGEPDLMGYHVFAANGRDDVYIPLTSRPVSAAEWADTVNMAVLNRPLFYKVTAVDYNNNPSAYSETLEVLRPDVVPPAAPLLHDFAVVEGGIRLRWQPSSSDDVVRYELRRQSEDTDTLLLAFPNDPVRREWTDTSVQDDREYAYRLVAADAAGHRTASPLLEVRTGSIVVRPPVEGWRAEVDKANGSIQLYWQPGRTTTAGAPRYILYRATPGWPLRSYQSFDTATTTFVEEPSEPGRYAYALKIAWPDGSESRLTEAIEVRW